MEQENSECAILSLSLSLSLRNKDIDKLTPKKSIA
jgi:hypothetical protein